MIAENLAEVRERVHQATLKSGRSPSDVHLLVVSKQVKTSQIQEALIAGATLFGENKIQDAVRKVDKMKSKEISWHFIGHLQKNKVKFLGKRFDLIHSIDSLELAQKIAKQCHSENQVQSVLLQVNVSGEEAKFGMSPIELEKQVDEFSHLSGIQIEGLMTMPPQSLDPEESRRHFAKLRELRDRLNTQKQLSLKELSMGMTNDFEVAIEEGATLVRVGSAIFGERK